MDFFSNNNNMKIIIFSELRHLMFLEELRIKEILPRVTLLNIKNILDPKLLIHLLKLITKEILNNSLINSVNLMIHKNIKFKHHIKKDSKLGRD